MNIRFSEQSTRRMSTKAAFLASSALATVLMTANVAAADTLVWTGVNSSNGNANTTWAGESNAATPWINQDNAPPPNSNDSFTAGDDVVFDATGAGAPTVTVSGSRDPSSITFDAPGYTITGGSLIGSAANGTAITITMNEDGTIDSNFGGNVALTINGDSTLSTGGTSAQVASVQIGNTAGVNNSGTLATNGTITNTGSLTSTGTIGTLVQNGATSSSSLSGDIMGDVTLNSGSVDLIGAGLTVDGDISTRINITVDTDLTVDTLTTTLNAVGVLTAGDTLTGDVVTSSASSFTVQDGATVDGNVTAGTSVVNGLQIDGAVTGDMTVLSGIAGIGSTADIDGELDLNGTVNVEAGATIGSVDNDGTFNVAGAPGTITLDGTGGFENDGNLVNNTTGALTIDMGAEEFTMNAGTIDADGTVAGLGGVTTITAGVIDLNGGTFEGEIVFDGDVENAITLTLGGTSTISVTGDITNESAGVLNIEAGGVVQNVTNEGDLNISGGTVASVDNDDGTTDITGGNVAGMTVDGGTVTNSGGVISGTTEVNDGVFNTSNQTASINSNGGQTNVSGGTTGVITNDGGDVNISDGSAVSVTNTDGTTDFTGGSTASLTVGGGTATNTGGDITAVVVNDGIFNTSSANTGTIDSNGGETNVSGGATGAITNDDGDVNISGGSVASVDNNSGTTDFTGGSSASVTVDGGTVTNTSGTITATEVNDGIFNTASANTGTIDSNGGETNVTGGATGAITNDDGDVNISGGSVASLDNNSGTADLTGGSVTGLTDIDDGTVTNSAGTLGAVSLTGGTLDTSSTTGAVTNDGGTVDVNGGTVASLDNDSGTTNLNDGSITTTATNADMFNFDGGSVGGNFFNTDGTATVVSDSTVTGTFSNSGGANTTIEDGIALTATGGFNNSGTINAGAGSSILGGDVNNGSVLNMTGDFTVDSMSGSGTINMNAGTVGDELTINGAASLSGTTINLDIDLGVGTSDLITVSGGAATGPVTLSFTNVGGVGADSVTVVDYDEGFAFDDTQWSAGGLPVGSLIYALSDTGTTLDVVGVPAAGALASGVTVTQSLISSVINRPSSPFVAGLAAADDNPCGAGMWGRAIGGTADAEGSVSPDALGGVSIPGSISADYYGIQLGGDFSCFGGYYNGWDLSFGGILGVNEGSTSQPVRNFVVSGGEVVLGDTISTNDTDFTQSYAGVYVGASRDRLFADLQYRVENTDYTVENPSLSLDDDFSTEAQTLSGSVGYVFPLNEELGINFVPSGGFAFTQTNGTQVEFDDGTVLVIEDSTTEIAFLAGTISRTQIRPDGISALNYFGTATIYSDFADPTESNFYQSAADAASETNPDRSESANLGTYGELSLGVNYTRLLEPGDVGPARQFNASVRIDGRFSETIESVGLTAQARLQF